MNKKNWLIWLLFFNTVYATSMTPNESINSQLDKEALTLKHNSYISFDSTIDEPNTNDPRIVTLMLFANMNSSNFKIVFYNTNSKRFANKLKDFLISKDLKNISIEESSINDGFGKNIVNVYINKGIEG